MEYHHQPPLQVIPTQSAGHVSGLFRCEMAQRISG